MPATSLTLQERRAINIFLSEHWSAFTRSAVDYLDDSEVEDLGRDLQSSAIVTLSEPKRMAVNSYLSLEWSAFLSTAEHYMNNGEVAILESKLSK